jgi:hypothetical protein
MAVRVDSPEYRKWYNKGWSSTCDLDYADRKGLSSNDAWMDGHADAGAGREKWHALHCTIIATVGYHTTECG